MSVALDRQIRPIYDALDTGSNKSALVSCNKLLKKHPKNELVLALKCLALVRSQKVEEALIVCDQVLAGKPTNEAVLSAMMLVLRGLGRNNDLVTMYDEAYRQQPNNEELAAQTFFANVRCSRWKVAQQVATKMQKSFQTDRYLYWSAMSAVLQASDPRTAPQMQTLLWKLAHRLITSNSRASFSSADRFYLHLAILKEVTSIDIKASPTTAQKYLAEAGALLSTDIGQAICKTNLSCDEVRRELVKLAGSLPGEGENPREEEARRATEKIREGDRNWLEFVAVLDGTFPPTESSEPASEQITSIEVLFEQIAEKDGLKDRSGLLGLLELDKRSGWKDSTHRLQLLQKYFDRFGDKACCFEDLKPFVGQIKEWTQFLQGLTSNPDSTSIKGLQRLINAHKLLRYNLQLPLTSDAEIASSRVYTSLYLQGLPLGKDLAPTELQPADDLVILAASALVGAWKADGAEKHLWHASVLLEYALTKSKYAFQARLMLVRIYRLLGAAHIALEHYRAMNVKQVQTDTLSHFILDRGSTFGMGPAAIGDLTMISECLEATQIYASNTNETGEYIVRAFSLEKYSQIPEFIVFEDRLENSLQRDITKLENLRMRMAHEGIPSKDVTTADLVDLELIELKYIFERVHHENRDFEILPDYQPNGGSTLEKQSVLFGKSMGRGWLFSFLRLYIRAFQQASDLSDTVEEKLLIGDRPQHSDTDVPLQQRLVEHNESELAELTTCELALFKFGSTLADWLEPFHDLVRPSASQVLAEAAKQTELKTGFPLKGIDLVELKKDLSEKKKGDLTPPSSGEDTPLVREPPESIERFFDDMKVRFEQAQTVTEALHAASLVLEGLVIFIIETNRFKPTSVVKIHKLGGLVASIKTIRTKALAVVKDVSAALSVEGTWKSEEVECETIDSEFVASIVKNIGDARKESIRCDLVKVLARLLGRTLPR
ncbi:actin cytoskeleton organization protein [Mycena floridula]|nr:actin cytoskeleton organization protein [Mycena floridula]